jgi:hypothetical protein
MYPKVFFENFWGGEQRNELFVCIPFDESFDKKFEIIKDAAIQTGFKDARRTKEDSVANEITSKILDGIANSRMLLFDLSDDPNYSKSKIKVNGNVLYELGIANAMREPDDILLIRKESLTGVPFDITGLNIHFYKEDFTSDWMKEKLKNAIENQKWYKSRRVETAAKSIDSFGLKLIHLIYKHRPSDRDHFNDEAIPQEWRTEAKLAILRMMDLGIVWFATDKEGTEYAYHWTPFGREVIKRLGIKKSKN